MTLNDNLCCCLHLFIILSLTRSLVIREVKPLSIDVMQQLAPASSLRQSISLFLGAFHCYETNAWCLRFLWNQYNLSTSVTSKILSGITYDIYYYLKWNKNEIFTMQDIYSYRFIILNIYIPCNMVPEIQRLPWYIG